MTDQHMPTFFGRRLREVSGCPSRIVSEYGPLRVEIEKLMGADAGYVAAVNPDRANAIARVTRSTVAAAVRAAERATVRALDEMAEQAGYRLVPERLEEP